MKKRSNNDENHNNHNNTPKRTRLTTGANFNGADFERWTVQQVHDHLCENDLHVEATVFKREAIDGSVLSDLTEEKLEKIGIDRLGQRMKTIKLIREIQHEQSVLDPCKLKVFNDPIHGHIELHPVCISVIDTPQFQRLRYLKQLGGTYYVFPGASHNRFEHSIGVSHLAGLLCRMLQAKQPELSISCKDVLCVELAGLCHDLGHGPFSHMFDSKFIPAIRPDSKWKHEDASMMMFDHLIESNNLREVFKRYGLNETDITFIKEQIGGPKSNTASKEWSYSGREESKSFLYEIVANKRNGIDVDKWDYFARDCHHLGIKNNFDHARFMKFVRVINVDGQMQICARDKEVGNLYDMFHTRNTLHRRAYQHKVANVIETMITEALIKADDHIKLPGKDGVPRKMSECIDDMEAYQYLTDDIFHQILRSTDPNLEESRAILKKIEMRNLYKCVGQTQPRKYEKLGSNACDTFQKEIIDCSPEGATCTIECQDLILHIINLNYGMADKNPIEFVRFYSKKEPDRAFKVRKDQVSRMLPETFAEQLLRLYCKKSDEESLKQAELCFKMWCKKRKMPDPKEADVTSMELTPVKQDELASSSTSPTLTHNRSFSNRLSF